MSDGPTARMEAAFGWREFPRPLFYRSLYALRFELAGGLEGGPVRLMRAMDRARAITALAFERSDTLTAVASRYHGRTPGHRAAASFKMLADVGFPERFEGPDRVPQHKADYIEQFGHDLHCYWYSADFRKSESAVTALLWAALVREVGISRKAFWLPAIHIVDFARRIVVFPYDDRGMDVVGPDCETLLPLYERFDEWLLDYDRAAMAAQFR